MYMMTYSVLHSNMCDDADGYRLICFLNWTAWTKTFSLISHWWYEISEISWPKILTANISDHWLFFLALYQQGYGTWEKSCMFALFIKPDKESNWEGVREERREQSAVSATEFCSPGWVSAPRSSMDRGSYWPSDPCLSQGWDWINSVLDLCQSLPITNMALDNISFNY